MALSRTSLRNPARPAAAEPSRRAWLLTGAGLAALFLMLLTAGVLAVVQNQRVKQIAIQALTHDVEIEDEAEDVRLGVLEVRHRHRNILLGGPSPATIADLDAAWNELDRELRALEALDVTGLDIPPPSAIRDAASRYWNGFRPALAAATEPAADLAAFRAASDAGLERLDEIEAMAQEIDALGTRLTADALGHVEVAADRERRLLLVLLGATSIAGLILAASAGSLYSRLRAAYAAERHAREEVAEALQTKKDFVADASHELRTPLAVIRGNADLGLASDEPNLLRTCLGQISTEAAHMTNLVDDLLFLARSDAGAPPLEREFVPARWLATRIEGRARTLAERRGACLEATVVGQGYLDADPGRIEQAVLALVDNAAKHAPPGSCVRLRAEAGNGTVRFVVEDDGPGIPADQLPLVFDRFYQVGPRRGRKTGGVGLGLPIVRSIAEAHGGRIDASSTPGAGTRMMLTIPMTAAPESDDAGDIPAEPAAVAGSAR